MNYFRFVSNFTEPAEALYRLLRKGVTFDWTSAQTEAINSFKGKLFNSPILKFPDYTLLFYLFTDASNVGIGALSMQAHDQYLLSIAYISKSLDETQQSYSKTKKKALALVYAVEQFRHLILCYETHIYTDHLPLLGALKKPTKDQCLQRWSLLIQNYKLKIHYREGTKIYIDDTLSRLPIKLDKDVIDLNTQFHNIFLERINNFVIIFKNASGRMFRGQILNW